VPGRRPSAFNGDAAAVVYSIEMENYATVPFMILFVWGYLYTGVMSLAQTHIERIFTFGSAEPAIAATAADSLVLPVYTELSERALSFEGAPVAADGNLLALADSQNLAAEVPAPKARAASAGSS
jgi:hypothetical protein